MKKMMVCMVAVITLTAGMMACNETKAYAFALDHDLLSESDVQAMQETNCLQRALDAFLARWEPEDAVNEVAKCAVEARKFKTVDAARKAIMGILESFQGR